MNIMFIREARNATPEVADHLSDLLVDVPTEAGTSSALTKDVLHSGTAGLKVKTFAGRTIRLRAAQVVKLS